MNLNKTSTLFGHIRYRHDTQSPLQFTCDTIMPFSRSEGAAGGSGQSVWREAASGGG